MGNGRGQGKEITEGTEYSYPLSIGKTIARAASG